MDIAFRMEDETSAGAARLVIGRPAAGRVRLTVRADEQRTGGHRVQVTRVSRDGDRLTIAFAVHRPAAGAFVTQALDTPAQTVSVDAHSVRGLRDAILVDESGAEVARINA